MPTIEDPLPKSLRDLEPTAIDGKKIEHVAKRLKCLRKFRGHVLGGKIAAAMSLRTNLAVGLAADPDGEVGDAPLVPDVLAQVRGTGTRPRLWVADRQFCDLVQPAQFAAAGDHFPIQVIRQYVAAAQGIASEEISIENLFQDVTRQSIGWTEVLSTHDTVAPLQTTWTAAQLARRLKELLRKPWREAWRKAPSSSHKPQQNDQQYLKGGHNSVYRILRDARKVRKKVA